MREWKRGIPALEPVLDDIARMVSAGVPGARVRAFAQLEGGLANTNIRVDLADRPGHLLLRLYQRDPAQAAKEAALAQRLEGLVPVPRVLHVGDDGGQRFALMEWIEGTRLELALSDGTARATLGCAAGAALARIHSVHFASAGTLDRQLQIKEPMTADNGFLIEFLRASLIQGDGARHVPRALAEAVIDYAERNRALEWGGPTCLTHFDYNGSNILVSDGAIAAVLDWEFAMAANPAPDFGNLMRKSSGARLYRRRCTRLSRGRRALAERVA
jgi:aminoglycoside phosphotransferase (APT) family kinase protein